MAEKLNQKRVDNAKVEPGRRELLLYDSVVPGLTVRVFASGRRTYLYQYRLPGQPTRRFKIDDAQKITLEQARATAKTKYAAVHADGRDLAHERQNQRSVAELAERFLGHIDDLVAQGERAPSTLRNYRSDLALVSSKLGTRLLGTVDRSQLADLHHQLRSTPVRANRILAAFSAAWSYGHKQLGWCSGDNPAKGVERRRERPRLETPTKLFQVDELPRLETALAELRVHRDNDGNQQWIVPVTAIWLLRWTGRRPKEILGLTWSDVDLKSSTIVLRDTKGDYAEEVLPLPQPAAEWLGTLPRRGDLGWVFWSPFTENHLVELRRPWRRALEVAQLPHRPLYALRHFRASELASAETHPLMLSTLLGHRHASTTQKYYARPSLEALRRAVE